MKVYATDTWTGLSGVVVGREEVDGMACYELALYSDEGADREPWLFPTRFLAFTSEADAKEWASFSRRVESGNLGDEDKARADLFFSKVRSNRWIA